VLKKFFGSSKTVQATDYISITIKQKANNGNKTQVVVAEGHGSWLEYIEFDGKTYWTIEEELPTWKFVNDARLNEEHKEHLLSSDSYSRVDHQHLRLKEFDSSEKEKFDLEEQQRTDNKLREAAAARRKTLKK